MPYPPKQLRNFRVVIMVDSGMTFRDVAEKLSREEGKKISFPAVYRIYKRDKDKYKDLKSIAKYISDMRT